MSDRPPENLQELVIAWNIVYEVAKNYQGGSTDKSTLLDSRDLLAKEIRNHPDFISNNVTLPAFGKPDREAGKI